MIKDRVFRGVWNLLLIHSFFIPVLFVKAHAGVVTIDEDEFVERNVQSDRFRQYVNDACNASEPPGDIERLSTLCGAFGGGSSSNNPVAISLGVGGGGAQIQSVIDHENEKKQGAGAGVSIGNFGILLHAMDATTERAPTTLESGFRTDLKATTVGLDYAFSNSFLLGVALTDLEDKGDFVGSAGTIRTESESTIYYAAWSITDSLSLDLYHGSADNDYHNSRPVLLGNISGNVSGDFSGEQTMRGLSLNYDLTPGSWLFGISAAMDEVDTDIEAYTETGFDPDTGESTLLELSFPEQKIKSSTTTLGLRGGYTFDFGWGALSATARYAAVEESENKKRFVQAFLPYTPGYFFTIETDDPDTRYNYQTLSLVASLDFGLQVFLTHEQRSGHSYLEDSSVSAGAIFSF